MLFFPEMIDINDINLTLIGDYGGNSGVHDLAFLEVENAFLSSFQGAQLNINRISSLSTGAFNTIECGFIVAQLAFNSKLKNQIIFHNVAPRKDDLSERKDNAGESLGLAIVNNVVVIGVMSGYSFSFFKDLVPVKRLDCNTAGSQFRSRDIFPQFCAEFLANDRHFSHASMPDFSIQEVPTDVIVFVDGYGNIKTNIDLLKIRSKSVAIEINGVVQTVIVKNSEGIFSVKDGDFVLSRGSSGWNFAGKEVYFTEIVLRGGSAAGSFNHPKPGDKIKIREIEPQ